MADLFATILNMSLTGSVVILLVLLARFLLKRSPKIFSYALWSVVLFRLLCPISFTAPVSILTPLQPEVRQAQQNITVVSYIPAEITKTTENPPREEFDDISISSEKSENPEQDRSDIISWIWAAGTAVMILQSMAQYFRLRSKLIGAMLYRGDVYLADQINMPFVMGVLRPKIYIPSNIPAKQRKYIIAHERHHIRRLDHVFKMLSFTALCIHWFNPLVWVAFVLAGRDMEMSCDEAVVKRLGPEIRADYSAALVRLATPKRIISGMPIAFGEGDTKGRVLNMAKWKKPKLWVSMICFILCIGILIACAGNPAEKKVSWGGAISVSLPEGYVFEQDEDGNRVFTDGKQIIGGERFYRAPDGFKRNEYFTQDFMIAMGIPEASDESLGHFGGGAINAEYQIEYFSDVANPDDRTLHTVHQFYVVDDGQTILDIWIDLMQVDSEVKDQIFGLVQIPEIGVFPQQMETEPVLTVKMPLEIGALPDGYSYDVLGEKCILFVTQYNIVGGIDVFDIPDGVYDPNDKGWFWLEKMGMSDFENPELCYIGGITSGNYGWVAEFASDVPEGTPRTEYRRHIYRMVGDELYDIWLDMMLLSRDKAGDISAAVRFLDEQYMETQPSEQSAEDIAFEKTAAVMEAVANGSCYIVAKQENDGNEGPGGYERTYLYHEGNYLHTNRVVTEGENITEAGEYYNRSALLIVDDQWFNNDGHQGEQDEIIWEKAEPCDPSVPWLGNRIWNRSYATYMDTLTDDQGTCHMFRYDKPYEDRTDYDGHYFVSFNFDADGNFKNVRMQVNLFRENGFTVTESIVSMDPEIVNGEIQREYQRAIG